MKHRHRIARAPRSGDNPVQDISFGASQQTPLAAGSYDLDVTQQVSGPNIPGNGDGQATYTATQSVTVSTNRFVLPQDAVVGTYPMNGDNGQFDGVLPCIVLTAPALPWVKAVGDESAPGNSRLAVLTFSSADQSAPQPQPSTIGALTVDLPLGVYFPSLPLQASETASQPITIIDLPGSLFATLTPLQTDLPLLAHVRQVTLQDGTQAVYSVVVGSRMAQGGVNQCYLVSLDGYADMLLAADGNPSPPGYGSFRFVVLASWTFASQDVAGNFNAIAGALNGRSGETALFGAALQWPDEMFSPVANLAQLGYVPVPHAMRQGSSTVSFYRGPLAPVAMVQDSGMAALPAGFDQDSVLRYDPSVGMFDASYAAAWQLGQLLAANSASLLAAQYQIKVAGASQEAAARDAERLSRRLGREFAPGEPASRQVARLGIEGLARFAAAVKEKA